MAKRSQIFYIGGTYVYTAVNRAYLSNYNYKEIHIKDISFYYQVF